jgi:hypothetical protein
LESAIICLGEPVSGLNAESATICLGGIATISQKFSRKNAVGSVASSNVFRAIFYWYLLARIF